MKTSSSDRRPTSRTAIPPPARSAQAVRFVAATVLVFVTSCGGSRPGPSVAAPPGVSVASLGSPVDFAFDSLDERPVRAEATRGAPTILAFVTTSSLSSQAQVDFLIAMAKTDGDRVHYVVVALEKRDDRELVELYKKALAIPFPVALADERTLVGGSAFGDLSAVPVLVLLDEAGRVAWRVDGRVVKSDELRRELRGLRDR